MSLRTCSSISWTFTGSCFGNRCGPIIRSTRLRSRSASWMMIRVYSLSSFPGRTCSSVCASAAQTAERVLDFVRESAHHRAVRGLAVEHALVACRAQQPIDLGKLDEKFVAARAVGQWRDRTVHGDRARPRQQQPHATGGKRRRLASVCLSVLPGAGALREQTGERLADHFLLLTSNSISPAGLIDVSRGAPSKVSTAVVRLSSMDYDGPWLMLISVDGGDPVFRRSFRYHAIFP